MKPFHYEYLRHKLLDVRGLVELLRNDQILKEVPISSEDNKRVRSKWVCPIVENTSLLIVTQSLATTSITFHYDG
jgi:hypothetical protein